MGPAIGERNITLNGRARDYHVRDFPGPLSIKSVISGSAVWHTDEGRFEIGPGSCLVINDRQPYSITVASKSVVETFCVFFARGFVEDVQRVITSPDAVLLDEPAGLRRLEFHERVRAADSILTPLLLQLYRERNNQSIIQRIAEALVGLGENTSRQAAKLPAVKAATREELLRRVHRARNVMEGSLGAPLSLRHIAREAALSPYHLHRSFTRLFQETPHAYLVRRRIEHAARLLKTTGLPVTEVCMACGFESLARLAASSADIPAHPPASSAEPQFSKNQEVSGPGTWHHTGMKILLLASLMMAAAAGFQADPDKINRLLDAIRKGRAGSVRELLDSDASLVDTHSNGVSATRMALYYRQNGIAKLLIERGAKLDVHDAASAGELARLRQLLAGHPELANRYSSDGATPLGLAAFFGHLDVAEVLLEAGAGINALATNPAFPFAPLHSAMAAGHRAVFDLLLARGANVNVREGGGLTVLHEAAALGHLEYVQFLLARGANAAARDDNGKLPEDFARERKHEAVAAVLEHARKGA